MIFIFFFTLCICVTLISSGSIGSVDLFGDGVNDSVNQGDRIVEVEIADLFPFKNYPFQIPNNVKMEETLYST